AKNSELTLVAVEPPRIAGYAAPTPLPKDFVQLGIPVAFPATSAEHTYGYDGLLLTKLLWHFFGNNPHEGKLMGIAKLHPQLPVEDKSATVLARLTETYGPSGHEALVREKVKELLPEWASKKTTTDAAGNLILRLGNRKHDAKTPSIAFVAHMDEIGYEVKKIEDDGRLLVDSVGGGYPQYFLGHAAVIQTLSGSKVAGVLELPEGWDKPNFEWPLSLRGMDEGQH